MNKCVSEETIFFPQDEELIANSSLCDDLLSEILQTLTYTPRYGENLTTVIEKCLNLSKDFTQYIPQPYILPWYQQLAWSLVFAIMILVAVVGNLIVVWIIVMHRRMRTVTNLFLLNLAVADFLLASGNASFNFVFMLNSHWPFGNTFCVISHFLANLTVSTSVFTILAMSLDRFVAVIRPLRRRMSRGAASTIILLVWILSSLLSFPPILYATTVTYEYSDKHRVLCYLVWPDDLGGKSYLDHVYNIVFLIVTYALPMSCMCITYTWIGCVLWASKAIGEKTDMQSQAVRSKRKVVHMLVAVMLIFGICWLPYHVYFLYTYYYREVLHSPFIQHVYLAIYWLAMSNSCYNPIVYYFMNSRFRNYFREVCFCPKMEDSTNMGFPGNRQALQLTAKSSFFISSKSRSTRLSFPKFKRERQEAL